MRMFTAIVGGVLVAICSFARAQQASPPGHSQSDDRGGTRWETQGVQVGKHLDNQSIYSLEGKGTQLAKLWKDRPVLLVTASLTCPVARGQCPKLQSIIDAFDPRVRVVLLYTIDAHPQTDASPYSPGKEWVTSQNQRSNILHRQPTSLQERLILANELSTRLKDVAPMFVDGMDNAAWKALGGGPNMGVLIDTDGGVVAKQGWLDVGEMENAVDALLHRHSENAQAAYAVGKHARPRIEAFIDALQANDRAKADSFYATDARSWFNQKSGPGTPISSSPWRAWDETLNARHTVESATIEANAVIVVSTEVNDFARLINFAGWRAKMTYWFNAHGEIVERLYEPIDVTPTMRECFKPALDWAQVHHAEELRAIYPNNEFAPSADTAKRWRNVLIAWRKATGQQAIK